MSTLKGVLCALAIVIAYGIAGRMDYDDAAIRDATQHLSEATEVDDGAARRITAPAAQAEELEPASFGAAPLNE
jgi:hypothetical protein